MYARQVLDHMRDLKVTINRPVFAEYLDGFLEDMRRKGDFHFNVTVKDATAGEAFTKVMQTHLEMSEAYMVDKDMMPLLKWASISMEDTDAFAHDLWPTPCGFLVYEEPLIEPDIWGQNMVAKAISWGRFAGTTKQGTRIPGTLLTIYTDIYDPRDQVTERLLSLAKERDGDGGRSMASSLFGMGRLQVQHIQFVPDGLRVGPPQHIFSQDEIDKRRAFVEDMETIEQHGNMIEHAASVTNPNRTLLALLQLLNQTVTTSRSERPAPKAAPRYAKHRLPSEITVITLRRIAGANRAEGESLVQWAHRWIVRGGWAWRFCSKDLPGAVEYEKGYHRKVWIAPFPKGPPGMPWKQSIKINNLAR